MHEFVGEVFNGMTKNLESVSSVRGDTPPAFEPDRGGSHNRSVGWNREISGHGSRHVCFPQLLLRPRGRLVQIPEVTFYQKEQEQYPVPLLKSV